VDYTTLRFSKISSLTLVSLAGLIFGTVMDSFNMQGMLQLTLV